MCERSVATLNYIMLELYMKKMIPLIFVFALLWTNAISKEPTMAILDGVLSNTHQKLSIKQMSFICEAYGVISPVKLVQKIDLSDGCKKSLENFYLKNPYKKHFVRLELHPMQMYRVIFRENKCLLFARGKSTISELLLREGLVVLEPNFRDREYENLYKYAQKSARVEAKGIWGDDLRRDCLAEIYE